MIIKRKHIGNPKNHWDIEIEREPPPPRREI